MDKILYHGTFLTMDESRTEPEAVLIRDGMIGGTGTLEEMKALAPDGALWDMEGHTVLPGFIRRPLPLKRGGVPAVNRQPKTVAAGNLRQRGGRGAGAEDIFGDAFTKTGPVAAGHGIRQQRLPGGRSSHEGRLRPREHGDSRRGDSRLRPSVCGEHERAGALGYTGDHFHSSRGRSSWNPQGF